MNIVVSVATYGVDGKIAGFLESLSRCEPPGPEEMTTVVLNTGGDHKITILGNDANYWHLGLRRHWIEGKPRQYASVMYEKIEATAPYCSEETILFNCDPDYHFNPYALKFAQMIFEENEQVDYLCLLKEPGLADPRLRRETLSGFTFVRYPSAMGGAIITKWRHFYPLVQEFFTAYGVTGEDSGKAGGFDQAYWRFLEKKTGQKNQVVMLDDFSLVAHCCLISSYIKSKRGPLDHMWAMQYDPRINPFEISEIMKAGKH